MQLQKKIKRERNFSKKKSKELKNEENERIVKE
jgi:hypothetical protein